MLADVEVLTSTAPVISARRTSRSRTTPTPSSLHLRKPSLSPSRAMPAASSSSSSSTSTMVISSTRSSTVEGARNGPDHLAGRPSRKRRADKAVPESSSRSSSVPPKASTSNGHHTTRVPSSSRSSSPLPALLSHLSLSPTFSPTPSTSIASGTFSFPIPDFSSRHSYPHLHPLSTRRASARPAVVDKRASPGPHPHLLERTKKRKLIHRFFRSEALLAGPSSPPPPRTIPLPSQQPSSSKSSSNPPTLRRAPSWWASVSRSFGEGRESNLGPREGEWVGEGDGWKSRLEIVFDNNSSTASFSSEFGKGPDFSGASSSAGGSASGKKGSSSGRSRTSRSHSSPPTFNHTSASHQIHTLSQHPNIPQVALKQHLLAVLRTRLASEGGGSGSRGGEAGLRFKKWVVYNSWMKRTNPPTEEDLLDFSEDLDTEDDGSSWITTVDSATLVNSALASLPLDSDGPSGLSLLSSSSDPSTSSSSIPMDLDPPPLPPSPRQLARELPTTAAPFETQAMDDFSYALGLDDRDSVGLALENCLDDILEAQKRPKIRRAFSLPGKLPSDGLEGEEGHDDEDDTSSLGSRIDEGL